MDVQMTVMDGLSATRQIREIKHRRRNVSVPILALSANAFDHDHAASLEAGCDIRLSKPIKKGDLLKAIRRWRPLNTISNAPTVVEVPPEIQAMAAGYVERRRQEIAEMREALARSEFDRLSTLGHNLKGAATGMASPFSRASERPWSRWPKPPTTRTLRPKSRGSLTQAGRTEGVSMKQTITVLLIEDDPDYAALVKARLAQNVEVNFNANWANTLSAGIRRLAEGGIDVALLDLSLPDSEGPQTFRALQKRARTVPVILLSGNYRESLAFNLIGSGAQDYLVKSRCSPEVLSRPFLYSLLRHPRREKQADEDSSAKVIDVLSAKGGFGVTTIACNLATSLLRQEGESADDRP